MNSRKITALLLSSAMALSVLTGCGGVNKDKTVATLNGEPVKLGVANFAARFGQAGADDFYTAYFGKNVWTSDLYGNGTTGQDNFKDSVMDSLEDMYVLQLHMDEYNVSITDDEKAAITAAAAQFMEDNSKEHLVWAALDEDIKMYPEFFKTELKDPTDTVKYFTTDGRSIDRSGIISMPDNRNRSRTGMTEIMPVP